MTFHALLVSKDDEAAAVLHTVLSGFGVSLVTCGYPEALCQVEEQKFDTVVVDFDDPHSGSLVLQKVLQSGSANRAVTIVLLNDRAKLRHVLSQGAHFVLYKPLNLLQTEVSLRPACSLIKRERRNSCRVPLQLPIQLKLQDATNIEGILLDLSETGMDVLAAQPLCPSGEIGAHFMLPDGKTELEVRGEITRANPNGEAGVRFIHLSDNTRAVLKSWVAANSPEMPPPDFEPLMQCKLTDLTLSACYVETEAPFPEHAAIQLCLKAKDVEVQVEGTVRVMHPGFGMGIEFASRGDEDRAQVEQFIALLSSRPGTLPDLQILPLALTSDSNFVNPGEPGQDDLLELLRRHESLSQEEFVEELRSQRNASASV